ncbi:HNH endonuclease [Streptomyces lasalocidi]|uniref:HNH nuclease domain-containing protein n=1 Tax=Streptomyces lasalocidi TaxID=324833 RepID=A0A4U5WML0_STRLS|nr:HNH endonuclease [Streptomyces lasalocidi]TKT03424.1 hypothetical protein E4U91_27240 [Streptomyces lasalocidi]
MRKIKIDENGNKICPGCQEGKPREAYYTTKGKASSRCKVCVDKQNKAWQQANPEKYEAAQREWRAENEGRTYTDVDGYTKYVGFAHPIATPSGITPYHRVVLFDKIGPGEHECHWCGKSVSWAIRFQDDYERGLVVDHVNGIKNDNRPENLVPSCQRCNTVRMVPIREALKPLCAFEGCGNKVVGKKDLCQGHHMQQYLGKELKPLRVLAYRDENGKKCKSCGTYKTWDHYYQRSSGKGYQPTCKPCMIASNRQNTLNRQAKEVAA